MEITLILNHIALFLTISYGITLGIRNWALRLIAIVTRRKLKISSLGQFYDGLFFTAILYFCTFGQSYILTLSSSL